VVGVFFCIFVAMHPITEILASAFFAAWLYLLFRGLSMQGEILKRLNKLEMENLTLKEAFEAKIAALHTAIEHEHEQVSAVLDEMTNTIADLRAALEANTINQEQASALLADLDGLVQQVQGIYNPPVVEEEEETEEEETEG
jgi:Spy/CpxP family protein refolding chaperone